ncbi:hypothetical protein ElyMa_004561000 [Elysia marginata]|uniref:Uncharacterized protein n=1 Tax=Elysia marginata TaxID=1093978 RepID=A0AAV4HRY2_9GAST|nr:hypothetical protein ElyMa_004561000 [Elysia marginata]
MLGHKTPKDITAVTLDRAQGGQVHRIDRGRQAHVSSSLERHRQRTVPAAYGTSGQASVDEDLTRESSRAVTPLSGTTSGPAIIQGTQSTLYTKCLFLVTSLKTGSLKEHVQKTNHRRLKTPDNQEKATTNVTSRANVDFPRTRREVEIQEINSQRNYKSAIDFNVIDMNDKPSTSCIFHLPLISENHENSPVYNAKERDNGESLVASSKVIDLGKGLHNVDIKTEEAQRNRLYHGFQIISSNSTSKLDPDQNAQLHDQTWSRSVAEQKQKHRQKQNEGTFSRVIGEGNKEVEQTDKVYKRKLECFENESGSVGTECFLPPPVAPVSSFSPTIPPLLPLAWAEHSRGKTENNGELSHFSGETASCSRGDSSSSRSSGCSSSRSYSGGGSGGASSLGGGGCINKDATYCFGCGRNAVLVLESIRDRSRRSRSYCYSSCDIDNDNLTIPPLPSAARFSDYSLTNNYSDEQEDYNIYSNFQEINSTPVSGDQCESVTCENKIEHNYNSCVDFYHVRDPYDLYSHVNSCNIYSGDETVVKPHSINHHARVPNLQLSPGVKHAARQVEPRCDANFRENPFTELSNDRNTNRLEEGSDRAPSGHFHGLDALCGTSDKSFCKDDELDEDKKFVFGCANEVFNVCKNNNKKNNDDLIGRSILNASDCFSQSELSNRLDISLCTSPWEENERDENQNRQTLRDYDRDTIDKDNCRRSRPSRSCSSCSIYTQSDNEITSSPWQQSSRCNPVQSLQQQQQQRSGTPTPLVTTSTSSEDSGCSQSHDNQTGDTLLSCDAKLPLLLRCTAGITAFPCERFQSDGIDTSVGQALLVNSVGEVVDLAAETFITPTEGNVSLGGNYEKACHTSVTVDSNFTDEIDNLVTVDLSTADGKSSKCFVRVRRASLEEKSIVQKRCFKADTDSLYLSKTIDGKIQCNSLSPLPEKGYHQSVLWISKTTSSRSIGLADPDKQESYLVLWGDNEKLDELDLHLSANHLTDLTTNSLDVRTSTPTLPPSCSDLPPPSISEDTPQLPNCQTLGVLDLAAVSAGVSARCAELKRNSLEHKNSKKREVREESLRLQYRSLEDFTDARDNQARPAAPLVKAWNAGE